jgi:hypothetical protein
VSSWPRLSQFHLSPYGHSCHWKKKWNENSLIKEKVGGIIDSDSQFPHKSDKLEIHNKKSLEGFHKDKGKSQSASSARIYLVN